MISDWITPAIAIIKDLKHPHYRFYVNQISGWLPQDRYANYLLRRAGVPLLNEPFPPKSGPKNKNSFPGWEAIEKLLKFLEG